MFEGTYSPPVYNDLYNFLDGAQDDIFTDSYVSIPTPSPNASLPVRSNLSGTKSLSTSLAPLTPDSNSNSTSVSGKTCKQKKTASSSSSSSSGSYHGTRNLKRSHQSSIMASIGRRSRRLSLINAKSYGIC